MKRRYQVLLYHYLQSARLANNAIQAELESKIFIGIAWACEGYKAAKALRHPFQSA